MVKSRFSLEGKTALVTGGARGLGEAIALALAGAGADVAVCSRGTDGGELQRVAEEVKKSGHRSIAVRADITSRSDVDSLVQSVVREFGSIDILVNNAGNLINAPLLEISEADWNATIDTHLKGYLFCCQAAGKVMIEKKKGSIINIASALIQRATPGRGAYTIAKAGIVMLTKMLAMEVGPHSVRVNAIGPGLTRTKLTESWLTPELIEQVEAQTPLHRLAFPEDIIGAAVFLASDASSFITGETILVDGGRYL